MTPVAWRVLALLLGLVLVSCAISLSVGAVAISPAQLIGSAFGVPLERAQWLVLSSIRAPRILLGLAVGASLAVSGAMLQGLFRNPLASPALIGVSSGASVGAAVAIVVWGAQGALTLPISAFLGGIIATVAVLRIGTFGGRSDTASLLLAGIAINAVAGAATGLLIYLSDEAQLRTLTFFTLGSLGGATWSQVAIAAPMALVPVAAYPVLRNPLNALLLGEAEAAHLGVDVRWTKGLLVFAVCVGVGACVAVSGVIGFVGLAVPHLVRLALGPDHSSLLPGSALLGAGLLVCADTLARTAVAPAELPIGILTTLLGGPFFLWLLMRRVR